MSLSQEAIQLIIDNAVLAHSKMPETNTPVAVLPSSVKLANMEHYQSGRARFRGELDTHSLADFTKYVAHHTTNQQTAGGFIDQDAMSATVIFNLGDVAAPGHADDKATLTLKPTASYTALQKVVGKGLSQQALAEWLEDWAPNVQAFAGEQPLNIALAIAGIRKMTIKATSQRDTTVGDFSASRSAMDEIEARSQETLPTKFQFTTVPFEGLQSATIDLRLSVLTGADTPVLKLRWVGEEAQREEFARQFKSVLEAEVGGLVPLTIGTFNPGN